MNHDKRARSDRREGPPPAPLFGELLLEARWRPEGPVETANDGWLRTQGLAPDRRERPRRK